MSGTPYAQAVGMLLYLASCTRPDISYAVGVLCRFWANPGPAHWKAVLHLLRYLKGTMDAKIVYKCDVFDKDNFFVAYTDMEIQIMVALLVVMLS